MVQVNGAYGTGWLLYISNNILGLGQEERYVISWNIIYFNKIQNTTIWQLHNTVTVHINNFRKQLKVNEQSAGQTFF